MSPATFLSKVVAPLMGKEYWLQGGARSGTRGSALSNSFSSHTKAINGTGVIATDWARSLERLTLRNDLTFLTMLQWREVFPQLNLLRPTRAWCSSCYEEARINGGAIYEPLLWTVRAVEVCIRHQQRLISECNFCGHSIPWLSRSARPGHCSNCSAWLGRDSFALRNDEILAAELQSQTWVQANLQEMIVARKHLPCPAKARIAKAVSLCIEQCSDGVMNRFASRIGKRKNTVWGWQRGNSLIPLSDILMLCQSVGLRLIDFFYTDNFLVHKSGQSEGAETLTSQPPSVRSSPAAFDKALVSQILHQTLRNYPPMSLTEVAASLNIHKRSLYKHLPKLSKLIAKRYRKYKQKCDEAAREERAGAMNKVKTNMRAVGIYPSRRRMAAAIKLNGTAANAA